MVCFAECRDRERVGNLEGSAPRRGRTKGLFPHCLLVPFFPTQQMRRTAEKDLGEERHRSRSLGLEG